MIYVFREQASTGAVSLAQALNGFKVKSFNRNQRDRINRDRNTVVVCWGSEDPRVGGRVLNGTPIQSKFSDALALKEAGVSTIEVSRTLPRAQAAAPAPPDVINITGGNMTRESARATIARLQTFLNSPPPQAPQARDTATWIPRKNNHVGGNDLLRVTTNPDYYSKKLNLVSEFRIHCFRGLSIRAGVKVPRDGATPHAWIRSFDGGWRIKYDDFKSKKGMRELAAKALEALHLDFGAVDIGQLADKSYVVLEVNRAPGLEGNTIEAYSKAIQGWAAGRAPGQEA